MDTDKNGFGRNQLTALINRRRRGAENAAKESSSFLVPDFLLTSPLRPRTSRPALGTGDLTDFPTRCRFADKFNENGCPMSQARVYTVRAALAAACEK
jgi:hypothetical protein